MAFVDLPDHVIWYILEWLSTIEMVAGVSLTCRGMAHATSSMTTFAIDFDESHSFVNHSLVLPRYIRSDHDSKQVYTTWVDCWWKVSEHVME
jgi:hypothetical protein